MSEQTNPIISFKNFSFQYRAQKKPTLHDINLDIYPGERVLIAGPSGSGKTTLMNMIAGIYFPDEGEIYVGDKAATIRSPRDALDLGIGMIHQHFKLVDVFSATENIALSMGNSEKFDLKKVHDKARAICEKYEFALDLDQKVYEMSVSQKQTLEIVKVLYRGADILILDEPTNDLDIVTLGVLEEYLQAFKGCVIVVSHDRYFVDKVADHLLVFCGGGEIREFAGTYSDYTAWKRDYEAAKQAAVAQEKAKSTASGSRGGEIRKSGTAPAKTGAARKLTFQEKREMEHLEAEIPELEQEKAAIEEKLSSGDLPFEELTALSERITALMDQIDTKSMRWLELSEIGG